MFTIEQIEKHVNDSRNKPQTGNSAYYVQLNDSLGFKFFFDRQDYNKAYKRQKLAAKAGLAPKVGKKFIVSVYGEKAWGFLTEHVDIVGVAWEASYKGWLTPISASWDYFQITGKIWHVPGYMALYHSLLDLFGVFYDLHHKNIGWTADGRLVCVDFS